MVVLSLPSSLDNFEGRVNHTAIAGSSETLVFVLPLGSDRHKSEISARLKGIAGNLIAVSSPSHPKQGETYIAKVGNLLERAHIIRRPTPTKFQIYLIDRGFQDEVEYSDLFEYPEEMLNIGAFLCICPVLVPSDELPKVDDTLIDRKCLCTVEGIAKSVVVFGFVKGKLSVESDDGLAELKRDSSENRSFDSFESSIFDGKSASTTSNSFTDSELMYSSNGSDFSEKLYKKNDEVSRNHIGLGKFMSYDVGGANNKNKQIGAFFTQTAFKEFTPEELPTIISVRFDKIDRLYSTFWVVNAKTFTTVEQVLKGSTSRLSHCENLSVTEEETLAKSIPCVVRTRTDSPFKEFYRAVPIRFDRSSRRFSIFLVDFGWFKWVVANDVYDISTLDEADPIRNLPVALIHCREDEFGSLRAKDLAKGRECKMVIKERDLKNKCVVSLYDNSEHPSLSMSEKASEESPSTVADLSDITSCRKLINDVCVQQLKVSLMMETLSTCPPHYQQPWLGPGLYQNAPIVPTFMPIFPLPFIMPVHSNGIISPKDVSKTENCSEEEAQKSPENEKPFKWEYRPYDLRKPWDIEGGHFNSSPIKRHEPGFNSSQKNNRYNTWSNDADQSRYYNNSCSRGERARIDDRSSFEDDKRPAWERFPKKSQEQYRGSRRGWIGGMQRNGSSGWDLTVDDDRGNRKKSDIIVTNDVANAACDAAN